MQLLTKEIRKQIPALNSQEHVSDPTCHVKFFAPWSTWTWYVIEASAVGHWSDCTIARQVKGDLLFFGYVVGPFPELGSFSLKELLSVIGPMGLKIERDISFRPTPLSEVKKLHSS